MTHEEFDTLVREVECGIGQDPRRLRRRVIRLALLGYAGLMSGFAVVAVCAAIFIVPGIIWFRDAWAALVLGLFLLIYGVGVFWNALWIKTGPPEGVEVTPNDAPALFDMLGELRRDLNPARFHRVLVIADCNAAVIQRPLLGVFGFYRNYLMLGLPMMENFSPEEFRGVLAHEFTHLARGHGMSGQWIYRLRRSWEQLLPSLSRPDVRGEISFRPLIRKFVNWYWPRFNAHAFVLSRAQEYEADAVSVRIAGAGNTATALVRVNLYGRLLDKDFWPDLWRQAAAESTPPADVMGRAQNFLAKTLPFARPSLELGFLGTTTNADTHPCLSDRLRAIRMAPDAAQEFSQQALKAPAVSAAAILLGESLEKSRTGVEEQWRKENAAEWSQEHNKAAILQDRLGGIERAARKNAADADALWDKIQVVAQLEGNEAALPLIRRVLELQPRHAQANFALGAILLQAGDPAGETCLETAMAEDEEFLPKAAPTLHGYYQRHGRAEKIRELYSRLDRHEKVARAAAEERQNVSAWDNFLPHDLNEAQLTELRQILAANEHIAIARLARKELKHFSKQRFYLLCVELRPAWHRIPNTAREQAVVAALFKAVKLPGRVLIFAPRDLMRPVACKLRKMPDIIVYSRGG